MWSDKAYIDAINLDNETLTNMNSFRYSIQLQNNAITVIKNMDK